MAKRSEPKDPRQRKLGAITPEVVDGLLPAQTGSVPTSVAEFEGWTAKDVSEWLTGLAPGFRQARAVVGLGLWVLRDRLNGETEYVAYARGIAAEYDVSIDTLTRWRRSVQAQLGLPDPEGAKGKSRAGRSGRAAQLMVDDSKADEESGARNAPLSSGPVEEQLAHIGSEPARQEDDDTPPDQQKRPEPDARAVEKQPPRTKSADAAAKRPSQPSPTGPARKPLEEQVHDLIDRFLRSNPEKVAALDAADPPTAVARADSLEDWADRYRKAALRLAAKGSKDPAKCQHPQSAHRPTADGTMTECGLCGARAFSGVSLSRMGERAG